MTEGLTRRRGAAASPAIGSSSGGFDESPTATPKRAVTNPVGSVEGRKVAYDPRDFENNGEAQGMPRLTIMEEVLLLGLKDKAVSLKCDLADFRDICHFGTTTSLTLFGDVSSSNSLCAGALPWSEIQVGGGWLWRID